MAGADVKEFTVLGLKMWQQVILCLVLGILTGFALKEEAASFKVLGTIFIDLIKMVVVPLVFLALVSGITSMGDGANFKRVGIKGIGAYLSTAVFAVIIGLTAGTLFEPGVGLHVNADEFAGNMPAANDAPPPTVTEFLLNLISTNIFKSFAEGHLLQVVVFSVLFGITMNFMGEKAARPRQTLHDFSLIVFKMIEYIVRLAPLAVFGFMAWSVGTQGMEIVRILFKLCVAVIAACLFQYALFGVMIAVFARLNPFVFYRKLVATQLMAFSTSSSKAIHYATLLLTCTLGSIGAAGIPSGSIIFMGMVLHSVGLPIHAIGLLLGVDRVLDMLRTTINITGDCAITLIVDATEGTHNKDIYYSKID
jgi:Na+/H+-dicarboxylate symporter